MLSVCYPRVNSCWVKKTNQTWHPSVTSSTSNISRCLNGSLTKHHAFHFCWHSNHPLRSYVIIFSSSSFSKEKHKRFTRMNLWCILAIFQKRPSMEGISESQASPNGEITSTLTSSKSTMGNGKSPVWNRVAIFTASGGLCLMNVHSSFKCQDLE